MFSVSHISVVFTLFVVPFFAYPILPTHTNFLSDQKKFLQTIGKHLRQGDVPDLNILVAPLVEQLDAAHLREGILGQHGEGRSRVLDLDFPVVRHYGHLLSRGRVS